MAKLLPNAQARSAFRASRAVPLHRPATCIRPQVGTKATMKALIFDCDGVIVETEDLHRRAYNAAFEHFNVECGDQLGPVYWSETFYDMLANTVGGGKPKMRWYFNKEGWPTSSVLDKVPETEEEQAKLIDTLQDWKSQKFQDIVGSGEAEPRPGVLRMMDEARAAGLKVAVCSAATKSSCVFTVNSLLGKERVAGLDCFLAGDDVPKLKPDPTIYRMAAERMGVQPNECVVIEDSMVGLRAATAAGMRCIITYTGSTKTQEFATAEMVIPELGDAPARVTIKGLMAGVGSVQAAV